MKVAVALILLLWSAAGHTADLPCPPKRYLCFEVRMAVAVVGEQALKDKARKCGWSERKIEEAAKCLAR